MTNRGSANRRNSKKSTGPTNTSSTRFNATKHGLLSAGITELDDAEGFRALLRDLTKEKDPQGPVETYLVGCAGLDMVRLQRARRLESEFITEVLNPPIRESGIFANLDQLDEGPLVDPGLPATMHYEGVERLVKTFQRYQSAIALNLFRTLHELERVQRMRKGEQLPAPAAVDVTVGVNGTKADEPKKTVLEGSLSKHSAEAETAVAEEDEATDVPPVEGN